MFSIFMFMCRDPGDTTSKVSCCIEPSSCFKNSNFDAIEKVPIALPLKLSLTLFCRNYVFTQRFDSGTLTKKA